MVIINLGVTVLAAFLIWICYYLFLPTLAVGFAGGVFYVCLCILVIVAVIGFWVDNWDLFSVILIGTFILELIAGAILAIISMPIFHVGKLQTQLGNVEVVEFDEMIKQIDNSQIPIVDESLAYKQADKKIGEEIALGSRVRLGDAAIQEVNGEIEYVIPLEHDGFWKWNGNHSLPGYITVSASNQNKVNFVTELDGEDINIVYSPSSYFENDLTRHIRNEGFKDIGLTEFTFEINDTGRPFWVVTAYKMHTFFSNGEAIGVIIVDAQTGETEFYALNEIPEWVDVVQPKEFIERQINNWGRLIHGFWNFAHTDMIEKTDLTLTVYVNGDCYYFTGMTSVGSDDSCVGFIMVNTRNKHSQICYMTGATEPAAMSSAQGLVSDFGYVSTEPLPLNVNGIPTYVMALKDEEGLIKSYAMVNIENYSIAARGNTLQEASRAYIQSVSRNSSTYVVGSNETYGYTYKGKVKRISSVVEDGSTYYYLILDGKDEKIFSASYSVSDELSITRDGDIVEISYLDDKNGTIDIIKFDNVAFSTQISEEQQYRNELDEGTSAFESESNQVTEVNPEQNEDVWNNMSDEEKAKAISEYMKSVGN